MLLEEIRAVRLNFKLNYMFFNAALGYYFNNSSRNLSNYIRCIKMGEPDLDVQIRVFACQYYNIHQFVSSIAFYNTIESVSFLLYINFFFDYLLELMGAPT
jgi:hypothetical protein